MMKKLLSRLIVATKRKRPAGKRQRGLAFEQMENRLALSTTTVAQIDLQIYSLTTTQGGSIAFDAVASDQHAFLDLSGKSFQLGNSSVTGWIGDHGFDRDFSSFDDVDSLESWRSNHEFAIPQPIFGAIENSNGIVSLGAIFDNRPPARGAQESTVDVTVASNHVATELAPPAVSVSEISLARGREMYFDVADVSGDRSNPRQSAQTDQATLTRINFSSFGGEGKQDRPASPPTVLTHSPPKTIHARDSQAGAIRDFAPAESLRNAVPTVSDAQTPVLPQEDPPLGEKVSSTSARDEAFADWRRREFLDSDEILSARTDESDEESSSWQILAALAAGGLVVRSRGLAGRNPAHQQLPLRKKSAIL